MSLPICPMCGQRDLHVLDVAAVIRLAPAGGPLRYSVTTLRTYRCPCGSDWRTSETVDTMNPEVLWVRKLAEDEADIRPVG